MNIKLYYSFITILWLCLAINANLWAQETNDPQAENNLKAQEPSDTSSAAEEKKDSFFDSLSSFNDWPREKKVVALNLTALGAIAAVGVVSWDYGSSSFHFRNESWFGANTEHGGADKLGHAFSAYALTSVYNRVYKNWGYSDQEAIKVAALSSWSQMTLMEFADGLSAEHGLCWEDEVVNTLGVGLAYLRHRYPSLKDKFDFRLEWIPSEAFIRRDQKDPFTDYSGQKYLIALKPDGFLKTNNPCLKALEIQFGYYARGYDGVEYSNNRQRSTYIGIGLNVTYLIKQLTGHDAGGVFDYIQIPYTYISASSKFR